MTNAKIALKCSGNKKNMNNKNGLLDNRHVGINYSAFHLEKLSIRIIAILHAVIRQNELELIATSLLNNK